MGRTVNPLCLGIHEIPRIRKKSIPMTSPNIKGRTPHSEIVTLTCNPDGQHLPDHCSFFRPGTVVVLLIPMMEKYSIYRNQYACRMCHHRCHEILSHRRIIGHS